MCLHASVIPCLVDTLQTTITYLVSSRPYIEICRVCKIYGRRGRAEPSIYFTNPTYFYVRSGTDQISVLFCRGPLFVYAILRKIRKFILTADKVTTSMLARKCDVASYVTSHYDVIDVGMKVKAYFEVLWVRKSRQKQHYLDVRCATYKTYVIENQKCRFWSLYSLSTNWLSEDSIATWTLSAILFFSPHNLRRRLPYMKLTDRT